MHIGFDTFNIMRNKMEAEWADLEIQVRISRINGHEKETEHLIVLREKKKLELDTLRDIIQGK